MPGRVSKLVFLEEPGKPGVARAWSFQILSLGWMASLKTVHSTPENVSRPAAQVTVSSWLPIAGEHLTIPLAPLAPAGRSWAATGNMPWALG